MRTIAPANFPPPGTHVLERSERRAVIVRVVTAPGKICVERVDIEVWLLSTRVFGGWYLFPEAGISLTEDGAEKLRRVLIKEDV